MIVNVLEAYAKDEQAAREARKGWIVRSLTLDLMYDNIPDLQAAKLDTKNFIYDKLQTVVSTLVEV